MQTLDLCLLKELLGKIKDGERFGLSTDLFAAVFPPGHADESAMTSARVFAEQHRCDLDYWRATNEVFFTKRLRPLPGRRSASRRNAAANASHSRVQP